MDLHSARGSNGFGPNPISYQDIRAWADMTGERPAPWEVKILVALDRAYLVSTAEGRKGEKRK